MIRLRNVDILEHCFTDILHDKEGQDDENTECHIVEPGYLHGVAIEDVELVDHVIVAEGEELGKGDDGLVHGHEGEGCAAGGETEHAPEGADTHGHAEGGHEAEDENAEALGGEDGEKAEEHDEPRAAGVGEIEVAEEVPEVAVEDGEPDEGLGEELAYHGGIDVASGELHEFVGTVELEFGTDAIGGDEEDEEEDDARDEEGGEIDVVVDPRVAHGMEVDGDGLEEGADLTVGEAAGLHGGLSDGCGAEGGDGLEVAHEEGSGGVIDAAVIIRHFGLSGRQEVVGGSLGDIEEGVDLVLLDGLSGFGEVGVVGHDAGCLEGIETADEGAGGGGVVEIDHADGHLLGLSAMEHRGEEEDGEDGEDNHAEQVNRCVYQDAALALRHSENPFYCTDLFHGLWFMVYG